MVPVVYVFAYFVGGLALALLLPAVVAAGVGEFDLVPDFLIASALLTFFSGALMLSLSGRERRLRPAQRYVLALMLWTLLPLFASVPLFVVFSDLSLIEGYFEAVSGLTTTGASVLPVPEVLPQSLVFWLALVQWLGGGLTLLVIVLVLAPTGVGGLAEAHARMVEHGGLTEKRRLLLVLRDIMPIYGGATTLCFILLMLTGVPAFEAVCLSFASVSTGGFTPRSAEVGGYVSSLGMFVLVIFMLYGATNMLWHRDLVRGRSRSVKSHRESFWVIGTCFAFGIVGAIVYIAAGETSLGVALRDGIFTATSIVSTTGLEARHEGIASFPITLMLVVVAIGAASFSTAGGIKFFRIGAMLVQGSREMNRLIYPHGIRPARFGSQSYDIQMMKAIWSSFVAFIGTMMVVSWIVAAGGVPYEGALLASVSALSNAGPIYESDWRATGDWPPFSDMPWQAQLALCGAMILGRLEIIAVLGLIVYLRRSA